MTLTEGPLKQAAARYAGARVARREDPRLLTGHGTFVDDVVRPGMLHACFVRSPFARARIEAIDAGEARKLDGVHAVLTGADLNPGVHESWYSVVGADVPDSPRPPLAEGEVRFVGDPVALVVAADRYVAEDAAALVEVDYEPLPAVVDYTSARTAAGTVFDEYPDNVLGELGGLPFEDVEPAFEAADHVVEATIHQQAYAPVPMETRGIVAEWAAASGELTVHAATQSPHEVRGFAARLLGINEHKVRVVARDTGGGFGQKVLPQREDMAVILAARRLSNPLKWIEDRQENLTTAGQSRHEHGTVRMGFDGDGTLRAASIDHVQDVGAYPMPWPVGTSAAVGLFFPGPYRIPAATFALTCVLSNTVGRTAYRGPWQFESVAREVTLDIAARRLGVDAFELRRRNLLRRDELPYVNPIGIPYDGITPLETFEQAVEILGYDQFRRDQAEARRRGRFLGVGSCTYVEPTTGATPLYATEGATIRVEPDGAVNVYVSGGSAGNSLETTVVQLTADALGVELHHVNTIQGDTAIAPFGGGTAGSRSGSMTAGAVGVTAGILRERMIAIAAQRLAVPAETVELAGGRARAGDAELTIREIARIAYFEPDDLPKNVPPGLEASGRYRAEAPMILANATHVCTCEVDVETGRVTLLRYIVSEDCGPMINPSVVEGQIAGGVVQGIGGVLLEHLAYDDEGNPVASTFMDYLLPTAADVPVIEYGHVESPGPGPGGYKGVGEGGAIGAPPAVINAVADALSPFGADIVTLPITPESVVTAIREARS
jgi:carbon-monoxide dehydrogenase large subunit